MHNTVHTLRHFAFTVFPLFSLYADVCAKVWVCVSQSSPSTACPQNTDQGSWEDFLLLCWYRCFTKGTQCPFMSDGLLVHPTFAFPAASVLFAAAEDFRAGETSWPPAPHLSATNRSVGRWNVAGGVEHIQPKGRCCKELKKPVSLNSLEPSSLGKLFLPQALISLGITLQGSLGIYPSLLQIFSIVVLNCLFPPKQTNPLKMAYLIS